MYDGLGADGFMAGKAGNEIVGSVPFMEEHGLIQFFRQGDELFEKMELVLFCRIHAVVIKARFPYGDDSGICRYDAPDFCYIGLFRFICRMRMDSGRPIGIVPFDKVIDLTVFPVLGPCEDTADSIGCRISQDAFRLSKRPGKQIETNILISNIHITPHAGQDPPFMSSRDRRKLGA